MQMIAIAPDDARQASILLQHWQLSLLQNGMKWK
jgi:hypothetical protein